MHQPKANRCRGLVFLMLISGIVHALATDKEQPIQVFADSANLSQKEHQGIYTGNVQFNQGSTHIRADNAITKVTDKNQLTLAIANGSKNNQAHYWAETEANKPPLHAYADSIRYYPQRHLIELKGAARVVQGNNSFSAAIITYDTIKQHVVSQSEGTLRTNIIIYPEKKLL
ncbi:MAG: lipopolysaccharide transport periplasmic protein LptA [Legionella sp.]|nr:lipopolysaccharide transport periplasmic protein LptA [Legionella sp.]